MRITELWAMDPQNGWRSIRCHLPLWLSPSGSTAALFDDDDDVAFAPAEDRVLLTPIEPEGDVCATLMCPDRSVARTLVNGVRVGSGLHLLRHGDQLFAYERELWLGICAIPDRETYDAERHGEPTHCARTKTRFQAGDSIVVCAGTPEAGCGMRYTEAAWAADMPCHGCGAPPEGLAWTPPHRAGGRSLNDLLTALAVKEG